MNLISELDRVKSKLEGKIYHSPHQLKIWRRKAAKLRKKINSGLEKLKEDDKIMNQLSLRMR